MMMETQAQAMPFVIEQTAEQLKAAYKLQTNSNLDDVRVSRCRALAEEFDPSQDIQLNLIHSSRLCDSPQDAVCVAVDMRFSGTSSKPEDKVLIDVEATFKLTYKLRPGFNPTEEQASAFKDGNAVFNCWPYAREFMQNMTMRMGLLLPPIPLLRVLPTPQVLPDRGRRPTARHRPSRGRTEVPSANSAPTSSDQRE